MIGKRLRDLRNELNIRQSDIAQDIGINPSAISQMESGKINPSLESLLLLWKKHKVDLHWLLTGEGEMFCDSRNERASQKHKSWETLQGMLNKSMEEIAKAKMDLVDSSVIDIPVVGEIAAGAPVESHSRFTDTISIRKGQLKGDPNQFVSLRVNGRSMEPSLHHDDVVIISKCNDWEKLSGKICAVRIDGAITLKMMTLDQHTQTVVLLPINEDYKPILIKADEHNDLSLIGSLASLYRKF
ncbi:MAG: XRE family transcriptional regulator [Candidatus Cloacimonadaceae bacterium]|jgi:SOS-response transcriptional repressor LexA|nr:XRE family transcriptional regulator [Candidatus Cloacimonadota bacterium]MDD3533198.1 XRE family transcriptional regulator [Candidatus Cloacimonadota bacterium]MDY0127723.1 XRE family transcriptional regulator [Candidatus Cloacimonadaceae bacterium]